MLLGHEVVGTVVAAGRRRHRARRQAPGSPCTRRHLAGEHPATPPTVPTSHRAAPISVAPHSSHTPRAPSPGTQSFLPGCSGRYLRAYPCEPRPSPNRPRSPGMRSPAPATSQERMSSSSAADPSVPSSYRFCGTQGRAPSPPSTSTTTRCPSRTGLARPRRSKPTTADAIAEVDADVAIECSGNRHGLESAIRGATRGGRVVMLGLLPTGLQPAPLSLVITRELELVGSFRFNDEIGPVLSALADGSLVVEPVISHEFGVQDALEAFIAANDASSSAKVLLRFYLHTARRILNARVHSRRACPAHAGVTQCRRGAEGSRSACGGSRDPGSHCWRTRLRHPRPRQGSS